ncbi:MAG: hypothetical protein H3Z51_00430 [archaeon]|nr:hypothetical protein [archaeon]
MGERTKIALGSFLGLSIALLLMTIMPPLSQEVAYSSGTISIVPTYREDITKGDSSQMIDIAQPDFSYLTQSPALINLALTLVFALFFSSILFLSIRMRLKKL